MPPETHADRRRRLHARVGGAILLGGCGSRPRNLPGYGLPFRQDSNFLYFTGCTQPDAALLIAPDGQETLFLPPPADDDALWHGRVETIQQTAAALGLAHVRPAAELADACAPFAGALHTVAVPDEGAARRLAALAGLPELFLGRANGSDALIDAIIHLRRTLSAAEIAEQRATAHITGRAHRAAMAATAPGIYERELSALFGAVIAAEGLTQAYDSIVTVRGEVLHNFHYDNRLEDGQLLLLDGGAEARTGYATDVTRTWPVSGRFSPRQRAAYDAVLAAQQAAIAQVRVGMRYRDIHQTAARVLARFLVDEGLLRGDPDNLVECGAHALFFPHGVGHLIGLDVHDLEPFGDRAHYAPGRSRSPQFGTAYLRLDLDLEAGMVVTIEPGLYFVPAILHDTALTARFAGQVDLERAQGWLGFGGIRIEDDVAVTPAGPDVLTAMIPKAPEEIEAAVQRTFRWEDFRPQPPQDRAAEAR